MSEIDRQILSGAEVSQNETAKALGLSRQRVSQVIGSNENFLTPVRVEAIYKFLKAKEHPGTEKFKELAEQNIRGAEEQLRPAFIRGYLDSIIHPDDRQPWAKAKELWIFSAKPKEYYLLEYLQQMEERVFDTQKSDTKLEEIVYFVPREVADYLCRYLNPSFLKIEPKARARVIVIESAAALICPRFVIFDPRSPKPIGLIVIDEDDNTYGALPRMQVDEILVGLRKSGIGGRKDEIFVPPATHAQDQSDNPHFTVRFDSWQDPMQVRI